MFVPPWGVPYAQTPNTKAINQLKTFSRESLIQRYLTSLGA
jgi:hypothetical protein